MDYESAIMLELQSKVPRPTQPKKHRRVMCVGMCVLDLIHICKEFPQEDTDKNCEEGYLQRGGNASNNCTVLRLLGCDCDFLGMLSDGPHFKVLIEDCIKRKIGITYCPHTPKEPPFSSVILVRDTRTIIHSNSDFPMLTHEHFKAVNLDEFSWVHFEARNVKDTVNMLRDIHEYNKSAAYRIMLSVEFERLCEENLSLGNWVDYIFLSKDFAIYLGWTNPRDAVFSLREKLILITERNYTKCSIICPWGACGVSVLDTVDKYYHIPATKPDNIIDTLGAGDTFLAATIYALHHMDLTLTDAVIFGNNCAGYKLGHRGYDAINEFNPVDASSQNDPKLPEGENEDVCLSALKS
ncbi:ketohexokinase-like [Teleopsis dalmanni]|uniref:ketohexokinase-like n=1 Tax=Teleopsis dalmanni TaxID=139649 RepID=UPI0018CE09CD|nr:ketohexokinase-like [Teleopsis dalmanni]